MTDPAHNPPQATQLVARYALIFAGGALGALLRVVLLSLDATTLFALFWINVAGSFLLGALVAGLSLLPASLLTTHTRAFFGTGILAGFTSYSALALGVTGLISVDLLVALGYGLATVIVGVLAAWLGQTLVLLAVSGARRSGGV